MNKLVINKLMIVDYENKCANSFCFSDTSNLIISQKNGQGKSSLVKSIYFALGANLKSFPKGWNPEKYIFQIEVLINNEIFFIKRHNKVISVKGAYESRIFKDFHEYSIWLQAKLNMKIELVATKSGKPIIAYVEAILSPMYIDQDRGWNGSLYKDTFDGLGLYKSSSFPIDVIDYYLDLSKNNILDKESQYNSLINDKEFINGKIDQIRDVYKSFQNKKNINEILVSDSKNLQLEIKQYIEQTNKLSKDIQLVTNKLEAKKRELDILEQDRTELKVLLTSINNRFEEIKYKCSYCQSILSRGQSLARLDLDDNRVLINSKIELITQKIEKVKDDITSYNKKIKHINEIYESYQKRKASINSVTDIESYINQNVLNELKVLELHEVEKCSLLESKIDKIKKEISSLKKRIKSEAANMEGEFEVIKNRLSVIIGSTGLDLRSFRKFNKLTGSGTNLNKDLLTIYLVYMTMIDNQSRFKLPFAIDSFVKNETDRDSLRAMFNAINSSFLKLENQTFFSIIEENLKYIDSPSKYIWVEYPLLRKDKFSNINELIIEVENSI